MTVTFDEASHRLRVDAGSFSALAALAAGTTPGPTTDELVGLTRAGAVMDGRPHAVLEPALAAVAAPLAHLGLVVSGGRGARLHQMWLSVVSAVLADVGDGNYDLVCIGSEFVPTTVARLTRLGLRPRLPGGGPPDGWPPDRRLPVETGLLDALCSTQDEGRFDAIRSLAARVPESWPTLASQLDAGEWRFWVADVTWPHGSRRLVVLDTQAGLLTPVGDHATMLVPTTPTDVWRRLTSILPSDDDLAGLPPAPRAG
ncbi:MAG: hypothetical protein L0H79_12950 [Intrasporangium sp.]|uniref:hypothetical protein n=1 Tax=Intrasporangium sp. TaxID=1925024 RepID=UPI002649F832|nr:hypothetical protein [Intrasporangium sp.]MDN5796649.1 hypothetical protein [Intrasporangium sp.]